MTTEATLAALRLSDQLGPMLVRKLIDVSVRIRTRETLFRDDEIVGEAAYALKETIEQADSMRDVIRRAANIMAGGEGVHRRCAELETRCALRCCAARCAVQRDRHLSPSSRCAAPDWPAADRRTGRTAGGDARQGSGNGQARRDAGLCHLFA